MERNLDLIHQTLQKLIGLHRQLMETVRLEREALVQADVKGVQEMTAAKQGLIEAIRQAEAERVRHTGELALQWKKPVRDLTLPNIVIAIQGRDPKGAESLRSAYNALKLLVERIIEQNDENRALVEHSLEHINRMKRNVLGEAVPKSDVYGQSGQKVPNTGGARLFSKEA